MTTTSTLPPGQARPLAATAPIDDASRVEVVVVVDAFAWREPQPGTVPVQFLHFNAYRGDKVWLGPAALARGEKLKAVARPERADAALAATDDANRPLPANEAGDDALRAMKPEQLIAYVTQFPTERHRVWGIERVRDRVRKTVARAAGFDPETGEPLDDFDDTPPGAPGF